MYRAEHQKGPDERSLPSGPLVIGLFLGGTAFIVLKFVQNNKIVLLTATMVNQRSF